MDKQQSELINSSRRLLLQSTFTEKEIARHLYVSESSLRDLYNKTFGVPPKRYIRKIKLKKAQTLLRTTNKTISEIAYSIGYLNTSKFTEAFKDSFSETPSNYRKRCGFGVEN